MYETIDESEYLPGANASKFKIYLAKNPATLIDPKNIYPVVYVYSA